MAIEQNTRFPGTETNLLTNSNKTNYYALKLHLQQMMRMASMTFNATPDSFLYASSKLPGLFLTSCSPQPRTDGEPNKNTYLKNIN